MEANAAMRPNKRVNTDAQQQRCAPLLSAGYAQRSAIGVVRGGSIMRDTSKITRMLFGGSILFLVFLFAGMVMSPAIWADEWAGSPSLPRTLLYKSESDENIEATSEAIQTPNISQVLPAQVSIFYPTMGQSEFGLCWQGLRIDSNDNVYPIGSGQIYKILPDGTLVNGVDDQDFFASNGASDWAELDESGGNFYTAAGSDVRVAPFAEGSTFSVLISGLSGGQAITLGQSALAGSLFATESANQVSRITLSPLRLSVFANGSPFFSFPEAIASAPDGTLYVVNIGFNPTQLTKITPAGAPSTFAIGTVPQVNRAVIVDNAGNVYWSHANGINKYDASGDLLGTLPGPPDKPVYGNPMGAAFDSKGNLYIVDNFDCKKIYKYTLAIPVTIDIKPGSFPNSINPKSKGVIPVAILTTNTFDATTVDPLSVKFGPNGATEAHGRDHNEDVDGDGDLDLVLHFRTQETGIQCGDTSASLTGQTHEGQAIEGSDSIRTVGCK
jgi:hypothetical protein